MCDVQFKFPCGLVYKAHKVVLCVDCPYFQALFRSSYRETLTGTITVVDIPYDIFVDVIGYLYTGMIPPRYCTPSGFDDLIVLSEIANHYASESLLTFCDRLIIPKLDLVNVVSLYDWSKSVNLPQVEKAALTFMANKFSDMCRDPEMVEYAHVNTATFLWVAEEFFNYFKGSK